MHQTSKVKFDMEFLNPISFIKEIGCLKQCISCDQFHLKSFEKFLSQRYQKLLKVQRGYQIMLTHTVPASLLKFKHFWYVHDFLVYSSTCIHTYFKLFGLNPKLNSRVCSTFEFQVAHPNNTQI